MECKKCGSKKVKKNGKSLGKQRYQCKECGKTFFDTEPKYGKVIKQRAILMYLNNVGIRKTVLFIGCSRTTVSNWVKEAKQKLDKKLDEINPNYCEKADIIELDEIYTFIKKTNQSSSVDSLF